MCIKLIKMVREDAQAGGGGLTPLADFYNNRPGPAEVSTLPKPSSPSHKHSPPITTRFHKWQLILLKRVVQNKKSYMKLAPLRY